MHWFVVVFSSHVFVYYFLPLVLLIYFCSPRRVKNLVLVFVSYVFYGWANPWFIWLMLTSTTVDYICGLAMTRGAPADRLEPITADQTRRFRQKVAIAASLVTNLGLLGFFKYFDFGLESYNQLMASTGLEAYRYESFLRITLPLGISFYTFQSMSYTLDVYRGRIAAERNFFDFACFVSMFPQLVAGPIVRFRDITDQLHARQHTLEKFARGIAFFSIGMAKKVILADTVGRIADFTFNASSLNSHEAWFGALAYAFQIYFDFSAYSDMAIGLGLMFGFRLPKNFDSPYQSKSITEFWQRWHISLSTWLRDYLYIPLGGNRNGSLRTYVNLATVMVLGGLWHGAAWSFVLWGTLHGGLLVVERMMGKRTFYRRLPRAAQMGITFIVIVFSWVLFRAENFSAAIHYWACMVGVAELADSTLLVREVIFVPFLTTMVFISAVIVWMAPQSWTWTQRLSWPRVTTCLLLLNVSLIYLVSSSFHPFIYFIF